MDSMERVTTKQAAKELNMDVEALQYLMRNDRLPIGYALKKDGNGIYVYEYNETIIQRMKEIEEELEQ